jgi:L-amino acid N-acyltransferase YncA
MPIDHELILDMDIRVVKAEDSDEILRWRNDDVTRAMSLNSEAVDADQHATWFARLLKSERRLAFVGTIGGQAVGWVRFDPLDSQDEFLVSIAVAPEVRSQGMGSQLLGLALRNLRSVHHEPIVYAKVKVSNVSSRKIFQKHGFRLSEDIDSLQTLVLSKSNS